MKRYLTVMLPGILVAATGVGAGDLVTASLAGMKVGLAILWAVPVGVVLKWALTEGLTRWQMATGTTLLEGWVRRLGSWVQWVFMVYLILWSFVVGGALINACGVAGAALLPVSADPVTSKIIWGFIHTFLGIGLVYLGGFKLFEKVMSGTIAMMFCMVLVTALLIKPDWPAVFSGLFVPVMPAGGLKWILGVLGGVGGTVTILSYGYWIREKGRAGEPGLADSRIDLTAAYVLTGLFSIAMMIIASRLSASGVKGVQIAVALADQLAGTLGGWARWCFLLGFWGAVFSSLLGVWQGVPYLYADFMQLRRGSGVTADQLNKTRDYRLYLWGIGILPIITLWVKFEAVQLTYAVMGALFMPLVALTLLLMNTREKWVGARFRNGWLVNVLLAFTLIFFAYTGILKIHSKMPQKPAAIPEQKQ